MSLIYLTLSYRRSLLSEIGLSSQDIGIVFASLGIFSAITAAISNKFNKILKNKTLSYFGIYYTVSIFLSGLVVELKLPFYIIVNAVTIMFGIQLAIKGPYQTLIRQYLSSFSTSSMRVKIMSASNILEGLVTGIISLIGAWLLSFTDTANASIVIGIGSLSITIALITYMQTRLGLKPEEYPRKDIEFKEVE